MFMRNMLTLLLFVSFTCTAFAQTFVRSQLPTQLKTPWEIQYGPDGYLWLTEAKGTVSRVDPFSGEKKVVYVAPDFYDDSLLLEQNPLCFMPKIGSGTLGLDLHPDFLNPDNAFIYFVYSYNHGTDSVPQTLWKVARIKWDAASEQVVDTADIVTAISNGYDHWGGRLMAIMRNDGAPMLYLTIGDHGISEINDPDCYENQSENPNNFVQNPAYDNGKIHRYNMDGSIPSDNPIPGNSFYTRGHRNPQGLMYIPQHDLLFDIEHGDRTDDEVNLLEKGMNYGWKWVRGYHTDNNYPGESAFIANYTPHPDIAGDRLVPAFYSFCAEPQPASDEYLEWCTPAPSDGIYYNSDAIPEWKNSFLITSLKNGTNTDNQIHVLRLTEDGRGLMPSTEESPNPQTFFAEDQATNGRLRDIAMSPDGKQLFMINNGPEGVTEKITVYTTVTTATDDVRNAGTAIRFFPNPASDVIRVESEVPITGIEVYSLAGELVSSQDKNLSSIQVSHLAEGMYIAKMRTTQGINMTSKFIRQ